VPLHPPGVTTTPRALPTDFSSNLADLLWQRAAEQGDRPAIIERERTTTYLELRARAAVIGGSLRTRDIVPGDRVAIMLERGSEAAAAFLGVVAAGAIAININETLRPRQIEHILAHSGAKLLLTAPTLVHRLPRPLETPAAVLDSASLEGIALIAPVSRLGDDPVQISYTSGSTGKPKGVVLSHGNLAAVTRIVVGYLGLRGDDRIASFLPFSFVYGLNQLLCALGSGSALVVDRSPIPQQLVTAIRSLRVTVVAAVPPMWAQLLTIPGFRSEPLPDLRIVTNAGGGIAPELVRRIREAQPQAQLFLMYGLTEALRSTYLPPDEVDAHPDAIGRAIPGSEIFVMREDGTRCAPGEVGELVQRGPTVALGYWNDPVSTAQAFRPNPLRPEGTPDRERVIYSGDLVRADDSGIHYFVGRRDHMIKTLGYRVSPDEICSVLYASKLVAQAVVTSEPCPLRGERIVACVALSEGASVGKLEDYCKMELPRYMQPARFDVRLELPRLPSGKFDLTRIRAEVATAAPQA
jgi:amino acid adenylation domain-containing protein